MTSARSFPAPRHLETGPAGSSLRMAVHEAGPTDGPAVVLCHGFPELAYSWRHQIAPLADAGYRVIAPDQRGYGGTQRPVRAKEYGLPTLCADLVHLLDALGVERAVFVGHDWGGFVVWTLPLLHPDRVLGVVGLNTPLMQPLPLPPLDLLRQVRGENNYIVAFQEPGRAEALLERDLEGTFRMLFRRGGLDAREFAALPADDPARNFELLTILEEGVPPEDELPGEPLLDADELAVWLRAYERSGFTGPVNWYRNFDANWHELRHLPHRIEHPCLYVGAADDHVLPPSSADGMEEHVADLEKVTIARCGHWTQQERPEEVNRLLLDWLVRRFPA